MTQGVYPRTQAHRDAIRQARLGAKASPEARKNQSIAARKTALNPQWRKNVSEGTRKKMRLPHIRKKHLIGLQRARAKHGVNFKGGQGQKPIAFVMSLWKLLKPIGYVREYSLPTGIGYGHHYMLDFALVENKIAIECDGPKHRPFTVQEKDRIKDARLKALGWKVIRVLHD
jgi:hypothetical protein